MEEYPNVDDPVVLRDGSDREYPSQVKTVGNRLLVVTQPGRLPFNETFDRGTEIRVAWADSEGTATVLPTRILAVHAEGTTQLWSLAVTGPASIQQRRRVERVDVTGPVALRPPDGNERDAVKGELIDASEKGIRCSVETGSADRFLGSRNEVIAEFGVGTGDFAVPSRVEFVRATKHPTQLEELVVVFDEPVADADALRKHLFSLEASETTTDEGDAH